MIRGSWKALLDLFKRANDHVEAQRTGQEVKDWRRHDDPPRKPDDGSWRVPTDDDAYNGDMKGWKGQGIVEYAFILLLVAVVVIVIIALVVGGFNKTYPLPTDVCPNTHPRIVESEPSWNLKQVTIDYIDVNGDTVHLLWSQPEAGRYFQLYARDVDPGDDCPR